MTLEDHKQAAREALSAYGVNGEEAEKVIEAAEASAIAVGRTAEYGVAAIAGVVDEMRRSDEVTGAFIASLRGSSR
jgi:hypothetical protein